MSLTREQFHENKKILFYIFIFVAIFGFFNIMKNQLEYKIILLVIISIGITYYIYNNDREKEIKKLNDNKGDLQLFNDINAREFKQDDFFFDFFRKNYFIKDLNKYTWMELIKHSNNYLKVVKLMDSEIKNKCQLLSTAKMEKDNILNLFSSIIVGIKPGTSNLDNNDDDIIVLTRERDILKSELDYHYGELVKKTLMIWKNNKNIDTCPIMDEEVSGYNTGMNKNMDLY